MQQILGIVGLLLISSGVLANDGKKKYLLHIAGGTLMAVYSFLINDVIFITLQIIFVVTAIVSLKKRNKNGK